MQHVIKKQRIQLRLGKKADAFSLQQRMSELYRQDVLPRLEALFDEACGEGQTFYIDSLTIDLGIIQEKELISKRGQEAFVQKIVKICKEKLAAGVSEHQASMKRENDFLSVCRQWMFYMQKGYLPWNVLQVKPVWKQKVLEALAVDYASVEGLRRMIQSNPQALRRIVEQHAESFLLQLTEAITARKQAELPLLLNELVEVLQATGMYSTTAGSRLRKQLWSLVLQLTAEHKENLNASLAGQTILQEYLGHPVKLKKVKPKLLNKLRVLPPVLEAWKKKAAHEQQKQERSTVSAAGKPAPAKPEKAGQLLSISPKEVFSNAGNTASSLENADSSIDEEGVFVVNAGIVLLHPFLVFFFNRLEMLKEGKFSDKASHLKALYLLHYLTTGEMGAEEWELVIPKMLTAYPLEEPVERKVFLSPEEIAEADHLLQEAIRQWAVLKSTSADALRGVFLQRGARLFTKNGSQYLQFETAALDILLDQLPWNLSIVKLPWMKNILRVEWR